MKILVVSDEESNYLWNHYRPGHLKDIDMILSAGDLKSEYLSFLVTMANRPLLYIHGNHDAEYDIKPPEGCECVDDKLLLVNGLRIVGLGGSMMYNQGPHQYTERQMKKRINRLAFNIWRAGGVDIVLTHAPVRGIGDEEGVVHRGFEAFLPLLDKYKPRYLIHGHVHQSYLASSFERIRKYENTAIINAYDRYIIDTDKD